MAEEHYKGSGETCLGCAVKIPKYMFRCQTCWHKFIKWYYANDGTDKPDYS